MPPKPGLSPAIQACLAGETGAWDVFVREASRLVYWAIWRAMEKRPVQNREDVCKEAFQDCFASLADRSQLEKLAAAHNPEQYLCVCAAHAVFLILRGRERAERSVAGLSVVLSQETSPDASEESLRSEERAHLETAMKVLDRRERSCIELCYGQGRTHREIGIILGMPQDTVSAKIRRSKDKLKLELERLGWRADG